MGTARSMNASRVLDTVLDRTIVPGYTRIGPALRRRWWPADPEAGSMVDRRVLITGATSGIGKAAAVGMAKLGATVHVHGHDPDHLEDALIELNRRVPDGRFHGELCDLADLSAVRRFAGDLAGRVESLHGLVHNAGTMAPRRRESVDGHEFTLAVMVLAPQLLTHRLTARLAAAEESMVLYMSSGGMYGSGVRADDPEYEHGNYSGSSAYARCKRMQVVLAQLWAERLEGDGISAASMHPGWVDTRGVAAYLPKFRALTLPFMRTPEQGADTAVWLLGTRPSDHGDTHFWHDRATRPTDYGPGGDGDPEQRRKLWDYVAAVTDTPAWHLG